MIRTIVGLCARDAGSESVYGRLRFLMAEFERAKLSWTELLLVAEEQGMASLLHKHLAAAECSIPIHARRHLHSLFLRTKQANLIRNRALIEILEACQAASIDMLLIKGIALANLVYSDPALRPMRDIDLLVRVEDATRAEKVLFSLGYVHEEREDIPNDYYHLRPLVRMIDGLSINIELHRGLFPSHPDYPNWSFDQLKERARQMAVGAVNAQTLCLEDMLQHVYLHGFRAPLTYEPFRYIHVADLVTIVERHHDAIQWSQLSREVPRLMAALAALHVVTPWKAGVLPKIGGDVSKISKLAATPYQGWPLRRLSEVPLWHYPWLASATLWPSRWWVLVYYGQAWGGMYWWTRFFEHPRALWRWMKSYCWHRPHAKR